MMDQQGAMEQLLGMAATEPAFRQALQDDPEALAAASGLTLSATERAMLVGADASTLERLIDSIGGVLPDNARRDFMRLAGAALVVLAGGALTGCPESKQSTQPVQGAQPTPGTTAPPEPPPPKPLPPGPPAGVRPDRPPPPKSLPSSRGARPDRPTSATPTPEPQPRAIGGLSIAKPHQRIGGAMASKPKPGSGTAKPKPKPKPDRPRPTRGIRPDRPKDL